MDLNTCLGSLDPYRHFIHQNMKIDSTIMEILWFHWISQGVILHHTTWWIDLKSSWDEVLKSWAMLMDFLFIHPYRFFSKNSFPLNQIFLIHILPKFFHDLFDQNWSIFLVSWVGILVTSSSNFSSYTFELAFTSPLYGVRSHILNMGETPRCEGNYIS